MKFFIYGTDHRPTYQNTSLVMVFSYFPSHKYTLYFSLALCKVLPRQIPGLDQSETDCIHNDRLVRILLLSLNWSPADCVSQTIVLTVLMKWRLLVRSTSWMTRLRYSLEPTSLPLQLTPKSSLIFWIISLRPPRSHCVLRGCRPQWSWWDGGRAAGRACPLWPAVAAPRRCIWHSRPTFNTCT